MNWLTNFVRPKIQRLVQPREVPEDLWDTCPACEQMIFHRELEANHRVCPHCDHHMRITPAVRLPLLFDDGAYQTIELPQVPADPLRFRDLRRYSDRLKEAQQKSGRAEGIVVAHGDIGGTPVVVAAFDFSFMGGSMGAGVGQGLIAAAELAIAQDAALIAVPASGGARMQEGALSLMQMGRTTVAVDAVKERGLPYIVLMTDPTTGGVSASFAMLGDIHVAEPGAVIGFAGARVIEQTIRETLPEGFQRAEYLREHGMVDMVVRRPELNTVLGRLLRLLRAPLPPEEAAAVDEAPAAGLPESSGSAGPSLEGEPPVSAEEAARPGGGEDRPERQ